MLFEEHSSSFSSPYLFNGKELDRETNLSYYGARYLDMKTSLWLNVDLFKEKYPSVGSYIYCLNNPINAKDPDGNDFIYVNQNGSINRVVVNDSPYITVVLPNGKGVLLSDLDISGSMFTWNNTNRQIVANVVGYYGNQAGVIGIGANYDMEDISLAYTDSNNKVWVHPNSKGGVDPDLNNKYDLMSTLKHEDYHKKEGNRGDYTYSKHAKVYLKQFQHSSFKKTSKTFTEGQMANFVKYIDKASMEGETDFQSIIEDFNKSNILGGYQVKYRSSGGTQLFNNKGEEIPIPITKALLVPN
ncbi:RHS repeat-associated core domain-containing protein [Flavobacterium sp. 28A]|uniref:RHS repeat-associated core domain-containing protein n=1 Tax=Flavobacterium sp. 28A TaxID=2735895 RepID=UPI0035300E4D